MALQIRVELEYGIDLTTGYFRINQLSLNADDNNVFFNGCLYASAQARQNGKTPIIENYYQNAFVTTNKTGNLTEQAYLYIKQLAQEHETEAALFQNYEDC